ncbi:MAG: acetoin utilization protein AcuC [Mycobacteriales bacterium]
MAHSTAVIWDDAIMAYDLGPDHPLRPVRLGLTIALARSLGVLDRAEMLAPTVADDDVLALVHDRDYIGAVKAAPDDVMGRLAARYGLGTQDNPIFTQMHAAAAMATGASVDAVRTVWTGAHDHAINIGGGLHHAMPDRASGFCVYDDPAVAIAWLLAQGAQRVAYVDIDVHHGDGVQHAFYDDPRVLTISVHESGRYLFPGTGFAHETGHGAGVGTAVNVPLPPGAGDAALAAAVDHVVAPALRAYRPQLLFTQLGCDSHRLDPLAHQTTTVQGQAGAHAALHALAHELCEGRWVATGGGGYALVDVVPRVWTAAIAEMTGAPLGAGETPADWHETVRRLAGRDGPCALYDDVRPDRDGVAVGVEASIATTRQALPDLLGA